MLCCVQVKGGDADSLTSCIEGAAVLESRLTAVEWSQIALVALQGTQARTPTMHATRKRLLRNRSCMHASTVRGAAACTARL